jgi:hypothetical protein
MRKLLITQSDRVPGNQIITLLNTARIGSVGSLLSRSLNRNGIVEIVVL